MTDKNIHWKEVKKDKIPFVDKGKFWETLEGALIFWHSNEAIIAQTWLNKNAVQCEKNISSKK